MLKRFHLLHLTAGQHRLDTAQARHLRDVLRFEVGQQIEVFDDDGQVASARVTRLRPDVEIEVDTPVAATAGQVQLTIASAVPKGARADWLIEKLSELGTASFVPLQTSRSVVAPESGKLGRWRRIAEETAKQCRRVGVMEICDLVPLATFLGGSTVFEHRWCLSTAAGMPPILRAGAEARGPVVAAIGPEGGWTDAELQSFAASSFTPIALTRTILRVETAAVAVASVVMSLENRRDS